jgi:hypothetical protein
MGIWFMGQKSVSLEGWILKSKSVMYRNTAYWVNFSNSVNCSIDFILLKVCSILCFSLSPFQTHSLCISHSWFCTYFLSDTLLQSIDLWFVPSFSIPKANLTSSSCATTRQCFFFFSYSFMHMCIHCLGHFSSSAPTPCPLHLAPTSLPFQAESVLPLSLILLKRKHKQ